MSRNRNANQNNQTKTNQNQNRQNGNQNKNRPAKMAHSKQDHHQQKRRQNHQNGAGRQHRNENEHGGGPEAVAHKLSVGALVTLTMPEVARLVGGFFAMVLKNFGLARLGGLSITNQTPGEAKVSTTIRPTQKNATNGQGGYTTKVAARKPNLFTLITRDETGNGWLVDLDERANLTDTWTAVVLYQLTAFMTRLAAKGTFVGALTMPGSEKTRYQRVKFSKNMNRAIAHAIALDAGQGELAQLIAMAAAADNAMQELETSRVTHETLQKAAQPNQQALPIQQTQNAYQQTI